MDQFHPLPVLCWFSRSRAELSSLIEWELIRNREKSAPIDDHMMLMRLKFFLKCLYMNGKVDNTKAMREVFSSYSHLITAAIQYLKDLHWLQDKELRSFSGMASYNCEILTLFEKEATTTGDVQRYRDKTSLLVIDVVS